MTRKKCPIIIWLGGWLESWIRLKHMIVNHDSVLPNMFEHESTLNPATRGRLVQILLVKKSLTISISWCLPHKHEIFSSLSTMWLGKLLVAPNRSPFNSEYEYPNRSLAPNHWIVIDMINPTNHRPFYQKCFFFFFFFCELRSLG